MAPRWPRVRGVRHRGLDLQGEGTETLDYVLDENVQIHGGNGFVPTTSPSATSAIARVNRIFEGTNEINRMLIPGMLVRRGLKGELPLVAAARTAGRVLSPSIQPPATTTHRSPTRRAWPRRSRRWR
jgi:hypothetical protein